MSKTPRLLPLIAVAIGGVVTIKAAGLAPGLFDGAQAWAQEAVEGAAPAPKPAAAVCALTPEQLARQAGLSPAEMRILDALKKRREELDARDVELLDMLPLMTAAEQKIDAKMQALNAVKAEVQTLLGQVGEREKAEIDRLVQVYSAMRPREAARVFATLDDKVRLPVAAAMRPRSLAAVMAQMEPAAARDLTEKLARRFEAQQQLAARAAAAASTAPTATAAEPAAGAPASTTASAPAATPPAAQPAARPATQPTARPAAARSTPRPANRRPQAQRPAAPASTEAAGPRPYQGGAQPSAPSPNPNQPRQSVE